MRRRQDHPVQDHPDLAPVDPEPDAEQLRRKAAELLAEADEIDDQRRERELQAAAEQAERDRQSAYLEAVSKARENLAGAVTGWEEPGRDQRAAQLERDHARELVAHAEADRAAAWAELKAALKTTDLRRIRDADLNRAAAEHAPALVSPRLEAAKAAARRATETRDMCAVVIVECWQAVGRLGAEALDGIDRPEAVPPRVDPVEATIAKLTRYEELHAIAMRDPKIRARRERDAALAAARREQTQRQAANAGAGWMNTMNRAARG